MITLWVRVFLGLGGNKLIIFVSPKTDVYSNLILRFLAIVSKPEPIHFLPSLYRIILSWLSCGMPKKKKTDTTLPVASPEILTFLKARVPTAGPCALLILEYHTLGQVASISPLPLGPIRNLTLQGKKVGVFGTSRVDRA